MPTHLLGLGGPQRGALRRGTSLRLRGHQGVAHGLSTAFPPAAWTRARPHTTRPGPEPLLLVTVRDPLPSVPCPCPRGASFLAARALGCACSQTDTQRDSWEKLLRLESPWSRRRAAWVPDATWWLQARPPLPHGLFHADRQARARARARAAAGPLVGEGGRGPFPAGTPAAGGPCLRSRGWGPGRASRGQGHPLSQWHFLK